MKTDIDIVLFFSESLVQTDKLVLLQAILKRLAPQWTEGLHAFVELAPVVPLDPAQPYALTEAVNAEVEQQRQRFAKFGIDRICTSSEFRGSDPSIGVIVVVDSHVAARMGKRWHWGNRITIQIRQPQIGKLDAVRWCWEYFHSCARELKPVFGYASTVEEYDSKNMMVDESCTQAIGQDISTGLPGLYWLNVFGSPYIELIGVDKLRTAPSFSVTESQENVCVALAEDGRHWDSPAYRATEAKARTHLGREFFFDRHAEAKPSKGIDLSLYKGFSETEPLVR